MFHKHLVHFTVGRWEGNRATGVQSHEWDRQCSSNMEQTLSLIYDGRRFHAHFEGQLHICASNNISSKLLIWDDILAASDPDKQHELDRFVKCVQTQFLVRILGEPKKCLRMEITYMRKQGICCVSQQSYVEKLARNFLTEQAFPHIPHYTHGC